MRNIPPLKSITLAIALFAFAPFAPVVHADPFSPSSVPDTAKWVIHFDMDAARNTKLWDLFQKRFIAPHQDDFDAKVQAVETLTGMKFPRDLHDVTLYGTSFDKDSAVILIHATVDQQAITDMLKNDPEFRSDPHNDHDILTWRDKDKDRLLHGAFFGQNQVIISPSQTMVETALDALDKKIAVLKPGSALDPAPAGNADPKIVPVLYLAGKDLSALPDKQGQPNPMLAQTDSACLTLSQHDDQIVAHVSLKTKTDKAARQIEALANGARAMISLAAAGQKADDKVKAASAALESLTLHRDGDSVTADLPVSIDALQNLIAAHHLGEAKDAAGKLP